MSASLSPASLLSTFLPSSLASAVQRGTLVALSCLMVAGCDGRNKTPTTVTPTIKPREPVIALALGGGGAKGFAHIGAIKVLESHGIKAKIVTGTSAGSFVGSLYASGKTGFQLQDIALSLEESDIRDLTFSKQGFITGQKLQDYVNKQVGNKPIQQFPIRFAAVATQLDNGKKVAFNRGNAGQAVRASCSIPNVFVPATIGGKRYVDGGLVSPIPVQTARDMGADIVIAIDISARPKAGQSSNIWGLLDQTLNIMGQQTINQELAQADIVIKPEVGNLGVLDLKARHQSILEGERAAQRQLAAIDRKIQQFKQSPQAKLPVPRTKLQ
ncbi:MAG: patatin-like phospholipase family protein [Moraxellaceae bacterium]|nr:MAG: patatin-like phospholipase family protein [Moraxellaceae bacterium]